MRILGSGFRARMVCGSGPFDMKLANTPPHISGLLRANVVCGVFQQNRPIADKNYSPKERPLLTKEDEWRIPCRLFGGQLIMPCPVVNSANFKALFRAIKKNHYYSISYLFDRDLMQRQDQVIIKKTPP